MHVSKNQLIGSAILFTVLILDFYASADFAIGILYAFSFFFFSKESPRIILGTTILALVLIAIKLTFIHEHASSTDYMNSGMSAVAISVVSVFSLSQRKLNEQMQKNRKNYIELLKRKNKKLNTYQESLNMYLLLTTTDTEGRITSANEPYCWASKFSQRELIGQNHRIVRSGEHSEVFYKDMWKTISSGQPWRGEVKSKAKDGTFFWTDTIILPVKDEKNHITEYFALRLLITDKKKLQEEQEENLKAFETILWNVSHRLRGPVTTCMGITSLMEPLYDKMNELDKKGLEHRKKCTADLETFSREISEFIQQIRLKSHSVSGKEHSQLSDV